MPTTRSKKAKVSGSEPGDLDKAHPSDKAAEVGRGEEPSEAAAAAEDTAQPDQSAKPGSKRKHGEVQEPEAGKGDHEHPLTDDSTEALPDNTVEQGKVTFMFRPKVTSPGSDVDVSDLDDVQRLYIILEPQQPAGGKCRLLVVAKKRLPDTKKHERFFAFVEAVGASTSELTAGLKEHTYTTKTRGERVQPAARPAGEGTYVIAKGGSKNGIHLGFKLSSPSEPGDVQDMLGIKEEGSFVLSAKNPDNKGRGANVPSAGPDPEYTQEQREEFNGRSWIGVEDRSLLDVAGTELLLVGAKDKPIETGELGEASKLLENA